MVISSMAVFQEKCKVEYLEWRKKLGEETKISLKEISLNDVFVVWSCKALQNWKAIVGNKVDDILAEYTFNGNKGELYEDVYMKISNRCITE